MTIPRLEKPPLRLTPAPTEIIQVLVADSAPIQSQLLTRALKARRDFQVSACALEMPALDEVLQSTSPDVILIAANFQPDFSLVRWLRVSYPKIAPVLLIESDDRELVVSAMRAGAKGIFLFSQTPFTLLCKCIQCVSRGEVGSTISK